MIHQKRKFDFLRTRPTPLLLYFAALALFSASCSLQSPSALNGEDTKIIKETIMRYDALLSQGYAKTDMTSLQEVAEKEQALKAFRHMAALGDAKKKMTSELVDIQFLDIRLVRENAVQVKTRETWNYAYTNIGAQIPDPTSARTVVYNLSYDLAKKNNRWYVVTVDAMEEEKSEG